MFITSKNKYLSNDMKIFGACSIPLIKQGTLGYLVRILIFWYSHKTMNVRWGNVMSDPFTVSNGVHQGGILSAYLFNVYMDDLSNELNAYKIGCVSGNAVNCMNRAICLFVNLIYVQLMSK